MNRLMLLTLLVVIQIWLWFFLAYLFLPANFGNVWWSVPFIVTAFLSTWGGSIFIMDWLERKYWS